MNERIIRRQLGQFAFVSTSHAKEKGEEGNEKQVNVEVLQICQVGVVFIQNDNGRVLGQAEKKLH